MLSSLVTIMHQSIMLQAKTEQTIPFTFSFKSKHVRDSRHVYQVSKFEECVGMQIGGLQMLFANVKWNIIQRRIQKKEQ